MKILEEDVKEYIRLVKEIRNKEITSRQAYLEFRMLLTVIAKMYLPKDVSKMFEINSE